MNPCLVVRPKGANGMLAQGASPGSDSGGLRPVRALGPAQLLFYFLDRPAQHLLMPRIRGALQIAF